LAVLSHVVEPYQDVDRRVVVLNVVAADESKLLGRADADVPLGIVLVDEKLLLLAVAGILWLLLFGLLRGGSLFPWKRVLLLFLRYKARAPSAEAPTRGTSLRQ